MDEDDEWDAALELQFKASARSSFSDSLLTSATKHANSLEYPSTTAPLNCTTNPDTSASHLYQSYSPSLKKQCTSSTVFDNSQTPQISFRFPGWGVEIKKERDQLAPSITRDAAPSRNTGASDTATGDHAARDDEGTACRPWAGDGSEDDTFLLHLPEEVLASLFTKLGAKDLCTLRYNLHVKLQSLQFMKHKPTLPPFP